MQRSTLVVEALNKFVNNLKIEAKSNTDVMLSRAFIWDEILKQAKKQREAAWDEIKGTVDIEKYEKGKHELVGTSMFSAELEVSAPAMRFSEDKLAELMQKSKYKVPLFATKEMCAKAKSATSPKRTLRILEK